MRGRRARLDPLELRMRGELACRRLFRITALQKARRVACYLPVNGEMDTWPLLGTLERRRKHCLLPVLHPFSANRLLFREWRPGGLLLPNRFGIAEPAGSHPLRTAREVDIVVVPLVAFDRDCNRLGMGGGFYDRSLWFRRSSRWRHPLLIGFAHEFQRVDCLTLNATDVSLDFVVTESAIYKS